MIETLTSLCYPLFCITFLWWLWGIKKELNDMMIKAKNIVLKLGSKKAAIMYCELKKYQKDVLNNEIKYWNDVRNYIIKCY